MSEHDELAKAMRGAKTLGQIIEKQCRDVLDVTGLHHLINEDGDGAWDVVWMRLFEMRDELSSLKESTIGRERLRGDSWRDRAQGMEVSRDAAIERADAAEAALAAVNPKPRTITTAEELDALGRGATVLDPSQDVWTNDGDTLDQWGSVTTAEPYGGPQWFGSADIPLPVTVLHDPETTK